MEKSNLDFNKLSHKCFLFHNEGIKKEVASLLSGFNYYEIKREKCEWVYNSFKDDEQLTMSIGPNSISILKTSPKRIDKIRINSNFILNHRTIEKRSKGIIYSIKTKQFASDNTKKITNLDEVRHTLTYETLLDLKRNINVQDPDLTKMLCHMMVLENRVNLSNKSDYTAHLQIHMHSFIDTNGERKITSDIPLCVAVNNSIISSYFQSTNNADYIYNIFHGIISTDMQNIAHLLIKVLKMPFNLKKTLGINKIEDKIVGNNPELDAYQQYIETLLKRNNQKNRQILENNPHVSYTNFHNLDETEQQKLLIKKERFNFLKKYFK